MHLEMPLIDYLQDLLPSGQQNDMSQELKNSEHFSDNIDELITTSLTKVKQAVESDPNVSHLNQNKEIVIRLYDQGIFNLKDSVIKIADRLGISKIPSIYISAIIKRRSKPSKPPTLTSVGGFDHLFYFNLVNQTSKVSLFLHLT